MNYTPLHAFAEKHRVPYNELCAAVRDVGIGDTAPAGARDDLPKKLMEAARHDALTWEDRQALGRVIARIQQEVIVTLDAQRYRKLRQMHWFDSPLAVAVNPKESIKLGHDTLSRERLDEYLDGLN